MAEVAVSSVLDRLIPLLTEEIKLLNSVHQQVNDIRIELEYISYYLKEADARAAGDGDGNCSVKLWVKHVREAAYVMEDLIDEYVLHVAEHHDRHRFFTTFMHKITGLVKKMKKGREIASKIQDLKASIIEIKEKSERYGFNDTYGGENKSSPDPRLGFQFVDDDLLVGMDSSRNEITNMLIDDGECKRMVISMVGMGGIGKTTLARKVLDEQRLTGQHFDCRAWIMVSQSYKVEEILRLMLRQFYESAEQALPMGLMEMGVDELIVKTREFLKNKRYVVVFDDVWKDSFWKDIDHVLLENGRGSRIMITTRSMNVAEFCKRYSLVHVHNLEPLPLELAQELLCRTAFKFEQEKQCPMELKDLSLDIVKRCKGLPLAIVAIGGLLSTKGRDVLQWKSLHDNLSAQLETNPHLSYVKKILSFSLSDMPYYLKPCFLSVSMFPEGHSISCGRLIRLWIGKGFINDEQGETSEGVARSYLVQLIQRSLLQIERIDLHGKVERCRVHDLMREVILSKSEELNFVQASPNLTNTVGLARHLSIYKGAKNSSRRSCNFQTHSIIFFEVDDDELPKSLFSKLPKVFTLLKVLDFEGIPLNHLHEELGSLFHLRYLSARKTKVKSLPKSLSKLSNLLILDLRDSLVHEISIGRNCLTKLKYLACHSFNFDSNLSHESMQGLKIHGSIENLKSLEKLYDVDVGSHNNSASFISELGRLKHIRKLGITNLKSRDMASMCLAIEQMTHLQTLRISSNKEEVLDLQSMNSPPLSLQHLWLIGQIEELPGWISKLKYLVEIGVPCSKTWNDSLKLLGGLPNLLELWVHEGYEETKFHFHGNQFLKLRELGLRGLKKLNTLIIDDGAFLVIEKISIWSCPKLEQLPSSIYELKCLKSLLHIDMTKVFSGDNASK